MTQRLIIFTRYPEPHKTKRRLIPALGPARAANLQREMTRHTLRWARELMCRRNLSVEVHYEGGDEERMEACFGAGWVYRPQEHGDLGHRMSCAFRAALRGGMQESMIVGSDCPGLTADLAQSGFDALRDHDVVLGPAVDGGYYLIGLRGEAPQLFEAIPWGTGDVLQRTLEITARLGLSVAQLVPLRDVDRPEDLDVWNAARQPLEDEAISVVIPTLNESAVLAETLRRLQGVAKLETIVVDASSEDETTRLAVSCGARVIPAARCRAKQMNAGAAVASGSLLLFLHADTRLPEGFEVHLRDTLGQAGVVAGAFELGIDAASRSLQMIETVANLRARYLHMPYGDQGLFVRADVFRSVGGFPELPIMEDFELVRRLRRRGRVVIARARVATSPRRWQRLGPWRVTWMNQLIVLGYYLGVSPDRLAKWYHGSGR
ncbi:MAG: TIGR04283 family arsenosugar biosynthesis glycosyltransferase [Pirellulaceae bacterium]